MTMEEKEEDDDLQKALEELYMKSIIISKKDKGVKIKLEP